MGLDPETREKIDALSHEAMARLWRFAPLGHQYFVYGPVFDYFEKRFNELGGWTPEISKRIGLDS